jgi:hypothetical protein
VGTVGSSALLGGLVDLDVGDDQVGGVKTLEVSVGLSVLEETEQELGGLDGPAGTGDTLRLACNSTSHQLHHAHHTLYPQCPAAFSVAPLSSIPP